MTKLQLSTSCDKWYEAGTRATIKVSGLQHRWLACGYDLETGHFLEVASMVVTWWIVAFLRSASVRWLLGIIWGLSRVPQAPHELKLPSDL